MWHVPTHVDIPTDTINNGFQTIQLLDQYIAIDGCLILEIYKRKRSGKTITSLSGSQVSINTSKCSTSYKCTDSYHDTRQFRL